MYPKTALNLLNSLKNSIKNKAFGRKSVYLDNASATSTDRAVLREIHIAGKLFANPSAIHKLGVLAHQKIQQSRFILANFIGAHTDEIIFTASGTESDNLAILGAIKSAQKNGITKPHIITSSIEHSAVIGLIEKLESENEISATYLPVDENGLVDVKNIQNSINENTILISVHLVNNEIGTLEPIKEISKIIRRKKLDTEKNKNKLNQIYPLLHTDAAQATAYIQINVNQLGVDMLSFNGQKMYGPKGIGVLYVKRGTPIEPVFIGGDQEFKLRPGTESLVQISGLAMACSITKKRFAQDFENLTKLRNYFISKLESLEGELDIKINIYAKNVPVSPHILMTEFENIFSESLVLYLDARSIYVSSKSACKADNPNESYVLKALKYAKIGEQEAANKFLEHGSVRFSLGRNTTKNDIDYVIKNLKEILQILKVKN